MFKFIKKLFGKNKEVLKVETRFISTEPQEVKIVKYNFIESKTILANHFKFLIETGQCKNYVKLSKFINKYGSDDKTSISYEKLTFDNELTSLLKQIKVLNYKITNQDFNDWLNSIL